MTLTGITYPGNSPLSWRHPGSTVTAFTIVLDKPMPVAEEVTWSPTLFGLFRYPSPHPQQHAYVGRQAMAGGMIVKRSSGDKRRFIRRCRINEIARQLFACELRPVGIRKGRCSKRHPFALLIFVKHLNTLDLHGEGTVSVPLWTHDEGIRL